MQPRQSSIHLTHSLNYDILTLIKPHTYMYMKQWNRNTFTKRWITNHLLLQKMKNRQKSKSDGWKCITHQPTLLSTYLKMLHYQMQNVNELRDCMPLLHNDLSCPVGQHLVPILHSGWHCRSQNGHRLSDNCSSFHCMGLEKTVKNLKQERNSYLKWEWRLWKQDKNNQLRTKEYSCKTILTKFLRALLLVNNTAAFSFIKFWWMSTFILIFTEHLRHAHARLGCSTLRRMKLSSLQSYAQRNLRKVGRGIQIISLWPQYRKWNEKGLIRGSLARVRVSSEVLM